MIPTSYFIDKAPTILMEVVLLDNRQRPHSALLALIFYSINATGEASP